MVHGRLGIGHLMYPDPEVVAGGDAIMIAIMLGMLLYLLGKRL